MRGIIHEKFRSVRLVHLIRNRRRRGDDVEVELPFDALLNNFHMQQPQKAATEAEAERHRRIRFENKRSVVQLQLHDGVFQISEFAAVQRVNAAEHHGLTFFIARQRLFRGAFGVRNRVAHFYVLNGFDRGGDIPYFARRKFALRQKVRRERAHFGYVVHVGR